MHLQQTKNRRQKYRRLFFMKYSLLCSLSQTINVCGGARRDDGDDARTMRVR